MDMRAGRARGDAREDSDVDLALAFMPPTANTIGAWRVVHAQKLIDVTNATDFSLRCRSTFAQIHDGSEQRSNERPDTLMQDP